MNCDELRGDYGAWALGIADDPSKSEIAAHLARNVRIAWPEFAAPWRRLLLCREP